MSVLILCGVAFFAAWFAWLIWYLKPKKQGYKMPKSVVKFPPLRIPSRQKTTIQNKPIKRAKPRATGFNEAGFNDRQSSISDAEKKLRGACFGDFSKSSSLIDFELKKSMGLFSRSEAAKAALDRFYADRSR